MPRLYPFPVKPARHGNHATWMNQANGRRAEGVSRLRPILPRLWVERRSDDQQFLSAPDVTWEPAPARPGLGAGLLRRAERAPGLVLRRLEVLRPGLLPR